MKKKITETQYRAILNFENALRQLVEAKVAIVRDNDCDGLEFYNAEDIEEFVSYDMREYYPEAVDITDYADENMLDCIISHAYYPEYGNERVLAVLK